MTYQRHQSCQRSRLCRKQSSLPATLGPDFVMLSSCLVVSSLPLSLCLSSQARAQAQAQALRSGRPLATRWSHAIVEQKRLAHWIAVDVPGPRTLRCAQMTCTLRRPLFTTSVTLTSRDKYPCQSCLVSRYIFFRRPRNVARSLARSLALFGCPQPAKAKLCGGMPTIDC